MAGTVVNDVVKLGDWEKSGWLQTSAKKGRSTFIFGSKKYASTNKEEVTVFFTSNTAFLVISNAHTEDEDLWSAEEFIPVIKSSITGNFPFDMEEYVAVIDSGEDECLATILEEYGIVEHKEDIEAHLRDVRPYGEETDINL